MHSTGESGRSPSSVAYIQSAGPNRDEAVGRLAGLRARRPARAPALRHQLPVEGTRVAIQGNLRLIDDDSTGSYSDARRTQEKMK